MEKRFYDYHAQTTLDRRYLAGLFGVFQLTGRVPRSVSEVVRWAVEEIVEMYIEQTDVRLPETTSEATVIIERFARGSAPSEKERFRRATLRNLRQDERVYEETEEIKAIVAKMMREGIKTPEQLKQEEDERLCKIIGFTPVEQIADLYVDGVADNSTAPRDIRATRPRTEAESEFEEREAAKIEQLRLAALAPRKKVVAPPEGSSV